MFGFLNINKPAGSTSRSAVNAIQKIVRPDRVGHAGTLDPLATGVLILGIGPATRLTKYVQAMPKSYLAEFQLGVTSETEDIEGEPTKITDAPIISQAELELVLPEFEGETMQVPPKFSALKLKGKRAYHLARQGKPVDLEPRRIQISDLHLTQFNYPRFQLSITCGSGTYVRSLGRDIARTLGSGAVMTQLERTAIGPFQVDAGISPIDLTLTQVQEKLIDPQDGLVELPRIAVPSSQAALFADGNAWVTDSRLESDEALAIDDSGRLLTILKQRSPSYFTPAVNFSHYWLKQDKRSASNQSLHD